MIDQVNAKQSVDLAKYTIPQGQYSHLLLWSYTRNIASMAQSRTSSKCKSLTLFGGDEYVHPLARPSTLFMLMTSTFL
jgi:hypothetical protein